MSLLDCYLENFSEDEDTLCSHLALCNDTICSYLWWRRTNPITDTPPPLPMIASNTGSHRYLLTLTYDPKVTKVYWFSRLLSTLQRKFINSFECALEHLDSNLHAHAYVLSSKHLRKRDFSKFPGFIKIDKITKDNGIMDYISKENKIFTSITELRSHYLDGLSTPLSQTPIP